MPNTGLIAVLKYKSQPQTEENDTMKCTVT